MTVVFLANPHLRRQDVDCLRITTAFVLRKQRAPRDGFIWMRSWTGPVLAANSDRRRKEKPQEAVQPTTSVRKDLGVEATCRTDLRSPLLLTDARDTLRPDGRGSSIIRDALYWRRLRDQHDRRSFDRLQRPIASTEQVFQFLSCDKIEAVNHCHPA